MPAPTGAIATEPRLYRAVSGRIEALIRAENIKPGERLPAERDLAMKPGVSRTSPREALIALEPGGGGVEVRGGSGAYVGERAALTTARPAAGPGPFEVLAARRVIEAEVAALAAKNATPAAVGAILVAVEPMARNQDKLGEAESAERDFHLALAHAAGNGALVGVLDCLRARGGSPWHKPAAHVQTGELRRPTLLEHRAILPAIAAHDVAGARQAMHAHLDRATRTFARG